MLADLVLLSFQLVLGQLQSFKIIESWTPSCPKFVSYLIFQSLSNPNVLKPRIFLKSSHQITQIPPNIPCLVALSLKFSQVHVTMVNLLATAWQQNLVHPSGFWGQRNLVVNCTQKSLKYHWMPSYFVWISKKNTNISWKRYVCTARIECNDVRDQIGRCVWPRLGSAWRIGW